MRIVTVVPSAAEALEAVRRERPDVLLSDVEMPGEDGYAFIAKVRALPPEEGGRTPAAALTAYARMEDRTKALRAGFQLHVPKPVDPAELVAVVANLATRSKTQGRNRPRQRPVIPTTCKDASPTGPKFLLGWTSCKRRVPTQCFDAADAAKGSCKKRRSEHRRADRRGMIRLVGDLRISFSSSSWSQVPSRP